ncbi:MAG: hypothetical protein AAB519_01960 [Patescibacteria group bacterium]
MRLSFFSKQGVPQWEEIISDAEKGVRFWQNTIVRFLLFFAILPIISSLIVLAFFIRPRETSIVLHYNVYFGVDVLGAWWQTYLLPLLGLFFFVVHTFLAAHFYQRTDRVASYLLLLAAGLISAGVLIASLSVAFINY